MACQGVIGTGSGGAVRGWSKLGARRDPQGPGSAWLAWTSRGGALCGWVGRNRYRQGAGLCVAGLAEMGQAGAGLCQLGLGRAGGGALHRVAGGDETSRGGAMGAGLEELEAAGACSVWWGGKDRKRQGRGPAWRGGVLRGGAGPGPMVRPRAGSGRPAGRGRKPEAAAAPARETWRALKVAGPAVGCRRRPGLSLELRSQRVGGERPPPSLPLSPSLRGRRRRSPSSFAPRDAGGTSLVCTLLPVSPGPSRRARSGALLGDPGRPGASPLGSSVLRSVPPPPSLLSFKRTGFPFPDMSTLTPLLPLPAAPQFPVSSGAAIVSSLLGPGVLNSFGTDEFS